MAFGGLLAMPTLEDGIFFFFSKGLVAGTSTGHGFFQNTLSRLFSRRTSSNPTR